ncbi:hypothetical protein [Kangiella sp.]|uniref:hypothetical protein n=1 Tax=Kangiella sp. TaxID=1920245 RepID=UPI003A8D2F03
MNYLIGALFGILLVLVVLGGFTYLHYLEVESIKQEIEHNSQNQPVKPVEKSSQKPASQNVVNNKRQSLTDQKQENSTSTKPVIYTWTDSSGNKHLSEKPPSTGNYQVQDLSGEGFSVIPMESTKPIQRSTASNRQANNSYQDPAIIKQQLISQNHTHCRWVVGRAYETYLKIEQHAGPNRSIYCDEYRERLIEMRKLAREGEACYYPYGYTSKC